MLLVGVILKLIFLENMNDYILNEIKKIFSYGVGC